MIPPRFASVLATLALFIWPNLCPAQTDEIQVYTGELVTPGGFSLTLHNNHTLQGGTTAALPGGVVPNHSLNGVPEFAYA